LLSTLAESNTKLRTFIVDAKAKILDLAIRGKLVPQDPADEPASILLERIRADKEEQIKAGKIKRDKKESFIFRGEDNSYYEKIGDDVRCIDDQLPYVIPENWAWARLSSISIINPKQALDENLLVSFVPMPLIEDGFRSNNTSEVRKWKEVRTGYTHFADGDIGVAKITPCFENRKSLVFHGLANGYGAGTTELFIIRCNNQLIVPEYLLWLMKTKAFIDGGIQTFSSAVGQQRVSKEYIERTFIPLPPVRAQKNICSKTVSLLGVIETLEQSLK
jgi:type I restriction enzyme S subunit